MNKLHFEMKIDETAFIELHDRDLNIGIGQERFRKIRKAINQKIDERKKEGENIDVYDIFKILSDNEIHLSNYFGEYD
ncbi:MAG: hypothetical protein Q8S32_12175 [Burkholderiaceae bacterium]|nr:hypothetical protein [Burkholderiaceae bacterium]